MENEIYQILKKHKLPLKKREEVLADLLRLFSVVGQSEQLPDDYNPLDDADDPRTYGLNNGGRHY